MPGINVCLSFIHAYPRAKKQRGHHLPQKFVVWLEGTPFGVALLVLEGTFIGEN